MMFTIKFVRWVEIPLNDKYLKLRQISRDSQTNKSIPVETKNKWTKVQQEKDIDLRFAFKLTTVLNLNFKEAYNGKAEIWKKIRGQRKRF